MKKWLSKLFVILLAAVLVACSGSKDTTGENNNDEGKNNNGGETKTEQTVKLAVWASSPAESNALEETVKSFEQKTGIKVDIEVIADSFPDVITTRFGGNNPPDVFYLEAYLAPRFINSGVLLDLTDAIDDQDDFYQPLLNAFKDENGRLFAVPKDYSTLATYVNTKLLQDAGYSIEDVPGDWEGLVKFAKELQAKLPEGTAAMVFDASMARHLSAFLATGLDPIKDGKADFTSSKATLDYLESIVQGQDDGYILHPQMDLGLDWAGAAFGAEKAVIMIEGNWVLSTLNQDYPDVEYQVLEAPTIGGNKQTMIFTVGYAIAKDTKVKDAAIEFVKYMTGEGQQQWSEGSGTFPTRQSVAEAMNLDANEKLKAHIEGAKYGTPWTRGLYLPVVNSAFDNQFQAALNGSLSIEEAMKLAEEEANAEIERQK